MAEANWLRHSLHIGLMGVRRTLRTFRRQRARLRLLALSLGCLVIFFGVMGFLYAFTLRSRTGPIPVSGEVRLGVIALWLFAVWFFAKRELLYWRRLDSEAFLRTTVSPRTAAVGLLLREFLTACLIVAFPTPFLIGVIGYAFQQPASLVLLPLTVGLFTATAVVVGCTCGFGYLLLAAHSRGRGQSHSNLGIHLVMFLVVGYVTVQMLFSVPALTELITVTWIPISWLVDLSVLGTPVTVSVGRAAAGVIGSLVGIIGGGVAAVYLATAYWATDPGVTSHNGDPPSYSPEDETLATAIAPLVIPHLISTPTRRMAQVVVLRLRRAPRRLTFLVSLLVSLGLAVGPVAARMEHPMTLVSVLCAVCVPWLAGAAFGLNPLGDEGAVLPATLTTSVSGRQFVRGLMLPGLLYGLPLTVASTLLTSVFSAAPLAERIGLVVLGTVLTVVAVVSAPAVGMRFPNFSAVTVGQSREVVPPSLTAVTTYLFLAGSLSGIAVLPLLTPPMVQELLAALSEWSGLLSPAEIRLGGFVGWLTLLLGGCYWAYRNAATRFATYTIN